MTLSDDQKKRLTMFLGECIHGLWEPLGYGRYQCGSCKYKGPKIPAEVRSFTTWQDLGDLKEKLEEKGMWDGFSFFAFEKWDHKDPSVKMVRNYFTDWLMNPTTFIPLVAEFLEIVRLRNI